MASKSACGEQFQLYNVEDIGRCENGALVICEGEDDLLTLKQLGLPGIAVPDSQIFESTLMRRDLLIFKTIFISTLQCMESEARARSLAARLGYKARLLNWSSGQKRNYSLWHLAKDKGRGFRTEITRHGEEVKGVFTVFHTQT